MVDYKLYGEDQSNFLYMTQSGLTAALLRNGMSCQGSLDMPRLSEFRYHSALIVHA